MNGRVSLRAASAGEPAVSPRGFARESFAGYAAHERRTPLATQRALLELALADRNAQVADWRETGENVLRACRQQEQLLEACLALSRSEAGLQRCEQVDLAPIAAAALRAHDLDRLQSVEAFEPAPTSGDPDLLDRLVANLISNAIRHNFTGGRIEIATRIRAEHAVLSVVNTGSVVPAEEVPRLFRPFHRLESSRRSFGVGLGLTIVAAIAAAHDAHVSARARPGGGLDVEISFPSA